MASKRPTTVAEYIRAAPREGQPHLRRLYAILKSVAPEAEEAIKWAAPRSPDDEDSRLGPRRARGCRLPVLAFGDSTTPLFRAMA